MNGKLIAIEGVDGSGKSTLVKYIADKLEQEGTSSTIIKTREIDRESLFQTIMKEYTVDINSPAGMFLFQFLHAHKVERVNDALSESKIVIADRWDLSFFVWHGNFGFFRNESDTFRKGVSRLAFNNLKPDLGIYLDVSVDRALDRRMFGRGDVIDDFEAENNFYTTVVAAYRTITEEQGWIKIDANDGFEQVKKVAWKLVQDILLK